MRFLLPSAACLTCALFAQQPQQGIPKVTVRPVQAQSSSTFSYTPAADGSDTVEIRNVAFEVTSTQVPGRPSSERLLLRKTIHSKQSLGDIGSDSTITLEAWRFGDDLKQKPVYTLSAAGTDGHTVDNALFVASRGLEEVQWWSVYKLGSGQRLFDTYVPLLGFSISREVAATRYAGLEIPPDDATDSRLKQANVVAVIAYASEDKVIREAVLTCDDAQRARLLRSYADATRTMSLVEGSTAGKAEPSRTLKLAFSENYPSPPNPVEVLIPLAGDDLDLARAQLPRGLHLAPWTR